MPPAKPDNCSLLILLNISLIVAKLQQGQVLGEFHWYINPQPPPVDAAIAMETLEYLEACNLIFERVHDCP